MCQTASKLRLGKHLGVEERSDCIAGVGRAPRYHECVSSQAGFGKSRMAHGLKGRAPVDHELDYSIEGFF